MKRQSVNIFLWYYDGSMDMTSKDYLPYLVLAIFMLVVFSILPLLLLALYPFRWFQRCFICHLPLKFKLALHIFMDTFHGCFENTVHDYRHFATLYMVVRFLNLLIVSVFSIKLYNSAVTILFTFTLALVAKFQPYKCKRCNTVDIIMLLAVITGFISSTMYYTESLLFLKWLNVVVVGIASLIIYCNLGFHILVSIFFRFQRSKWFRFLRCICKHNVIDEEDESEALLRS